MNKWLKSLIAVGVIGAIGVGVYFAVPAITDKSWSEIFNIEKETLTEKSKLILNTNGNLTFICADDKGNTYTEEELEAKEWQGETLTFTLAPNDGYMLWSTKVNGEEIALDNNMFTVKMDKDVEIDVDVQEIKEYTANIVEDRYSQWQLTVNGEPLNDGDTIHTGDLITGRVISLTSGYRTQTFLVNDVEYVYLLDKYGFIQQPIRVENTDLTTVTFATSTVRDVSSLYVPFGGSIDKKNVISSPTFTYTSETCSVYNITYYGIRVGEEVKMDFTITNSEYFGGITLNGEPLEVTTAEDGVTASCTFIVPATECTLEVVSTFEDYAIPFEYDDAQIIVTAMSGLGTGDFDSSKNYVVTSPSTSDSFSIEISTIDSSWVDSYRIVVEIDDGDVIAELSSPYELVDIPYTAKNVKIYFEEIIETSTFGVGPFYNFTNYGTIEVIDDGTETLVSFVDGVVTYDTNKTGKVILKVTVNDPSYFDEHGFAVWYGSTKIPVFDYQTEYTFELDPKEIEVISYMDVYVVACGKYIVNYDEEIFTVAGGNSYEEHYGHSDDNHTFLNSELESIHNIYIIGLIDPSLLDTNNVIVTCDSEQRTLTKEDFSSGSYEVLGAYKEITITLQPIE